MAHLVPIRVRWPRGGSVSGAEMAAVDSDTEKSVNADEGGTWSPSAQVEIAGAGVVVAGPWVMDGALVQVLTASGKPIRFERGAADDVFGLADGHAGAAPAVTTPFLKYHSSDPYQVRYLLGSTAALVPLVLGGRFFTPLGVHSGAGAITTVDVKWAVREAHASIPQLLPRMRVIAVARDGTVLPLRAQDATTEADGFQYLPTPASGAAYHALGAIQTWTYTCNVAHEIDIANYRYFIEFIEESGANAWVTDSNKYQSAIATFTGVTLFDGRN